ncbi:MAG: hypothetical protein QM656_15455, partial [Paracoccaceae bacterium]
MPLRLALFVLLFLLSPLSLPAQQITVTRPGPAQGAIPLGPCAGNAARGCAEVLLDAADGADLSGLVPCWTLPPFGTTAVQLGSARPEPAFAQARTWRLRVEAWPLDAILPGSYRLAYGLPDAAGHLQCAVTLEVERKAGTLAPIPDRPLGDLRVEVIDLGGWMPLWKWAPTEIALDPATAGVPVGPLAVPDRVTLAGADRSDGGIPLSLHREGPEIATRPGQVRIAVARAPDFQILPPLGRLEGLAVLAAPQLAAPVGIGFSANARIGMITIALALLAGIVAGRRIRVGLTARQALAATQLACEELVSHLQALRAAETDPELVRELTAALTRLLAVAERPDATAEALTAAIAAESRQAETLVNAANETLAGLRDRLRPQAGALAHAVDDPALPAKELAAWKATADRAAQLLAQRRVTEAEALEAGDLRLGADTARTALRDEASALRRGLDDLANWTEGPFRPLSELAGGFTLSDAGPVETLDTVAALIDGLQREMAAQEQKVRRYLGAVADGATARLAGARDRVAKIMADWPDHPR